MSGRWKQSGPRDEAYAEDGDAAFAGVDMRTDPVLLPAGMVSLAVNYAFTSQLVAPRGGFRSMVWAQEDGFDFPLDFPLDFVTARGFGTVYGAGKFADPFGREYHLIACADWAYRVIPNAPPQRVKYPLTGSVTGPVTFCQGVNVLLMFRGDRLSVWKLETTEDFTAAMQFEEVPDETTEDYTSTIPQAARGLYLGSRIFIPYSRSRVAYSDVLSYTRYDAALSQIWVNDGDAGEIQALVPFGENAILALKDTGIYAITGAVPSPSQNSVVQSVTQERGCIAPETARQVGNDVWFLSDGGVYAISQALDNKLQAGTEPISAPMQPLFDRVNWGAASRACAAVADQKYFLALPVDGAAYNNVLAVYDFLTGRWTGWWTFDWLDAAHLLVMNVQGKRTLAVVSGRAIAGNEGVVYVLTDDYLDARFAENASVPTELVTRGLSGSRPEEKRFHFAAVDLSTWWGAGEISLVCDGPGETGERAAFEKDRTRSYVWGRPAYDPANPGDNHGEARREDYSVVLGESGVRLGRNGVACGLHQISSERMRLRQKATYAQLRIRGTRGRVAVRAVRVTMTAGEDPIRTKV